ncbi:ejaculatory bulb-specific protein 3-like [Ischnura elegans]|uniref:ejaculatory bulb-specific protein 3-like n=1 Tax=Ischnura elegans TaxID=197161 RepID=UPI001ED877B6|nr:ejaculatory bulb-specific protein 3-like [Ischnura elegans]
MRRWQGGVVLLAAALLAAVAWATNPTEHHPRKPGMYTSRYDHINVDNILKSERLLKNYFDCLMDRGPCTADGSELKRNIPDALRTGCSKCTEKQEDGARKVIKHLMDNKPDLWKQLEAKWDPDGEYTRRITAAEEKRSKAKP